MNEETERNPPNQSFFSDKSGQQKPEQGIEQRQSGSAEFVSRGSNRKLDEPWDIHFTIGSAIFINLITFLNEISYDALLIFKKKELTIISIDAGTTHASTIRIEKTEFSDYIVRGLEKEDEVIIYIDISVIIDELSINEEKPLDFYADTVDKNRFYVINGKGVIRKQLTTFDVTTTVNRYKSFLDMMNRLIARQEYQKVIVNQVPLSGVIKSLSKKKSQKKNESVTIDLALSRTDMDFRIGDEVRGSSDMMSGEDVMVYPVENDLLKFNLDFFNKFGKLKLTFNVTMYVCGNKSGNSLPLVMESRFGGGKVICSYLIAPRIDGD